MELRPYQQEAVAAIRETWGTGIDKTLLVLPTGTGKTVVFSQVAADRVWQGGNVLILAHREELLQQAADKLQRTTGLASAVEKAEQTAVDAWENVTVGSVQTLQNENRLALFSRSHFDTIIVDEAHHAVSPGYRKVLDYFDKAKVLGVTATADRGDKRNLGEVFDTIAYEYTLPKAIRDGYLVPIKALTLPLDIDLGGVKVQSGDYQAAALGTALEPYLDRIAELMAEHCKGRKVVVFLPLIATSQKMRDLLIKHGMTAAEVNGQSPDRAQILQDFHDGKYQVLCNSMLLTEGWDEPAVDCIVCLRPTKVRALYAQIVGRGTRLHPGKKDLLLLDFLWHTDRHDLCRPAHLVCENTDISRRVAEILAEESQKDGGGDLLELEEQAESAATEEREEALRKQLEEQRRKQKKLVDPLQFEMSITVGGKVSEYVPDLNDLRAQAPATESQLAYLESKGIDPGTVTCAGHASKLIDTLQKRVAEGLSTPKQIRCLERFGFVNVGTWSMTAANRMISRLSMNRWRIPSGISAAQYVPGE